MKPIVFTPPPFPYVGPLPPGLQAVGPDERDIQWAVFGGAFNPPTLSHEWIVEKVLEQVQKLLVVPSWRHPFKGEVEGLAFEKRVELLRRCLARHGERVVVSEVEKEMEGVGYTVLVLERLMATVTEGERPVLVIGEDLLGEIARWHRTEDLLREYRFLVMPETGLHATGVREAMQRGEPVDGFLSDLVREGLAGS